jgi:hypothetical protein
MHPTYQGLSSDTKSTIGGGHCQKFVNYIEIKYNKIITNFLLFLWIFFCHHNLLVASEPNNLKNRG